MDRVLPVEFYSRDTLTVAKDLLGKILVVRQQGKEAWRTVRIVETEAYGGNDPASHCAKGKTERCAPMFLKPGIAYVYFIYGMYEMLNFVTEPEGYPGAVLIRAAEFVSGNPQSKFKNPLPPQKNWTNGPGKLTRALGVEMKHNGCSLQGPDLTVVDDGFVPDSIYVSPRVGISKAVTQPWRFFVGGNVCVSRCKENAQARPLK